MNKEKFYITTTIPYVNAPPHIGFALEIVQADVIARYHTLLGTEVVFGTGTDEHGLKIYRQAVAEGKDPQAYVDEYAPKFEKLKEALNVSYTNFIRTTDPRHTKAAQEFWQLCAKNGDIEKKLYKIKYCVGCELEKTDSELEDGLCPIHPNVELEIYEEENYFFKFSKYQQKLLDFYEKNPDFVVPDFRFNEIKQFVRGGLNDFSISRLKEKMPWGVPVPGDDKHVMYVWFDALVNYISTLGWPSSAEASEGKPDQFEKFWVNGTTVQIAGKDQLRQQCAMWQAMLISAGLPNTKQVIIHGFITSGGQKMSKSLGNVIDPFEVVEKYGTDALRYWLLREMPTFEDGDFTWEKFKERYNADLADGLGNHAKRVMTSAVKNNIQLESKDLFSLRDWVQKDPRAREIAKKLEDFQFSEALRDILSSSIVEGIKPSLPEADQEKLREIEGRVFYFDHYVVVGSDTTISVRASDQFIEHTKSYKAANEIDRKNIRIELNWLYRTAILLEPFMPETAKKVQESVISNTIPDSLFPRLA